MKASIKLAVIGLAVLGGAAQAANINTSATASTGSSLLLMLKDSSNGTYLNFELSTKVSDLNSFSYLASVDDFKYSADGDNVTGSLNETAVSALNNWSNDNLTSYLASNVGHSITWTIIGGKSAGVVSAASNVFVATSTEDHLAAGWDGGKTYNASNAVRDLITEMNAVTWTANANQTQGYGAGTFGGQVPGSLGGPAGNGASVGTAQSLYEIVTGSDSSYAANVYKSLGTLTLSSTGLLTYSAATTATPIPAALWLLGSGLLGLVGIGRRREAVAA